jgi:hypothetical protein
MIHILIDEETSIGLVVNIDMQLSAPHPSDADLISLGEAILASDAVQNSPQWNGTPSLTSVSIDENRGVYPTP